MVKAYSPRCDIHFPHPRSLRRGWQPARHDAPSHARRHSEHISPSPSHFPLSSTAPLFSSIRPSPTSKMTPFQLEPARSPTRPRLFSSIPAQQPRSTLSPGPSATSTSCTHCSSRRLYLRERVRRDAKPRTRRSSLARRRSRCWACASRLEEDDLRAAPPSLRDAPDTSRRKPSLRSAARTVMSSGSQACKLQGRRRRTRARRGAGGCHRVWLGRMAWCGSSTLVGRMDREM